MINYKISYSHPHRHYVDFELTTNTNGEKKMCLQLPAWRPGRYELANFAENIQKWSAFDENNQPINTKKITKDLWEVNTKGTQKITIYYSFYANILDAGRCYLDDNQLYLNPVNCMFYIHKMLDQEYELKQQKPNDYIIATSLKKYAKKL